MSEDDADETCLLFTFLNRETFSDNNSKRDTIFYYDCQNSCNCTWWSELCTLTNRWFSSEITWQNNEGQNEEKQDKSYGNNWSIKIYKNLQHWFSCAYYEKEFSSFLKKPTTRDSVLKNWRNLLRGKNFDNLRKVLWNIHFFKRPNLKRWQELMKSCSKCWQVDEVDKAVEWIKKCCRRNYWRP